MKKLVTFGLLALAAVSCGGDDAADSKGMAKAKAFFCGGDKAPSFKADDKTKALGGAEAVAADAAVATGLKCFGEDFDQTKAKDQETCESTVAETLKDKDFAKAEGTEAQWTKFKDADDSKINAVKTNEEGITACEVGGLKKKTA